MKKIVIRNYEREKFNNFSKIIVGFIKTAALEMSNGEQVDLFPTNENVYNKAYDKFCQLKRMGIYDDLNRMNLKVCEGVA